MTGESDILIAYFSLTNNREYPSGEMDAVSSASLKLREGIGYGHAELLALAAREVTGGDSFPIKTCELYPETYNGAFNRHHDEMGTDVRPELTEHLDSIESRLFTPVKGRKPDYYVKCRHCGVEVGVTKLNNTDPLRACGPGADRESRHGNTAIP